MSKPYRYEMHCHTSEVSGCARVPAAESYRLHRDAGYHGIMVTDHFFTAALDALAGPLWADRVDAYLAGYRNMKRAAAPDFSVLLGLEFRFAGSVNDYLVFGVTPELLAASTDLDRYDHAQLRAFADAHDLLIVQAHPFRDGCTPDDPAFLDGVEVYNGNLWHQHNSLAQAYAERYGLIQTSGSDFHQPHMLARGGIRTDRPIRTERELVALLRSGDYELVRAE
ncbi:MAG: PHP domain-containing protein [Clostridia bacterium]|nr:PHP domain-containing protein [Clostridia bacterium]